MASGGATCAPPRVQSAPSLLPSGDDIESIFSNLSYRDFLHEPTIAEEGEPAANAAASRPVQPQAVAAQMVRQSTPPIGQPYAQPQPTGMPAMQPQPGLPQRPHTAAAWGAGEAHANMATPDVSRQLQLKLLEAQAIYEQAQQMQASVASHNGAVSGRPAVASVSLDLLDQIAVRVLAQLTLP